MKVWAIANQKGGVGKTTTSVSLAGLLVNQNKRVLMVDLDPHGSLTAYFGHDPETTNPSVYDVFRDDFSPESAHDLVYGTTVEGLDLIPSCTALATLDRQLGAQKGKGFALMRALKVLSATYDHVFLDCPPILGILMVNTLAACDELIIPVQTEFLALKGLERMVATIDKVQHSRTRAIPYHIVPTLFDRRTKAGSETLTELKNRYGNSLWDGTIPVDTQFRQASKEAKPLTVTHPWARGSQAYRSLLEYLLTQPASQPEATEEETANDG